MNRISTARVFATHFSAAARLLAASAFVLLSASAAPAAPNYPQRWNYAGAKLSDDAGLEKFIAVLRQSHADGCTHILMPEAFDANAITLSDDPGYLTRVAKVKEVAKECNLTLVPTVYAFGYALRYLSIDPTLAAGLPVHDMPFVVKGNAASPDPAAALDTSSLKPGEGGTIDVKLKARPFMHYRLSFVTPKEYKGDRDEMLRISTDGNKRWVTRRFPLVKKDGDKYRVETTFNTLELDGGEMRVQINVPAEDIKIEPAGLLMLIRRDLLPLSVTSEDGQIRYEEGKDYKPVPAGDLAAAIKDEFAWAVQPANIELTEGSRIKDGQKLLVSFFHAYRVYGDQNIASLEDPKVLAMMERDVANTVKVWGAEGYFMNYDEIRVAGWEPRADGRKLTPGQMLSEHTKMGYDLIRKHSPNAKVYTWSDMYSPFGNAYAMGEGTRYYYLIPGGTWEGSWEGLPGDIIIMNWQTGKGTQGVGFFADKGHEQVLCGYYDAGKTEQMKRNIRSWLTASEGCKGVLGFMYTTWSNNYSHMEEYFKLLDTVDAWLPQTAAETQPAE